jgi:hypothetical protein
MGYCFPIWAKGTCNLVEHCFLMWLLKVMQHVSQLWTFLYGPLVFFPYILLPQQCCFSPTEGEMKFLLSVPFILSYHPLLT